VNNILALDVGDKRIGVALMRTEVGLPQPLTTLANDTEIWSALKQLIETNQVTQLVVGLPRNLNGDHTPQTASSEAFARELKDQTALPVSLQDEALTSVEAENVLRLSGKPYEKADVDALAASLILADYSREQGASS
jgi:putative holliday junction resolvase